MKLSSLFVIVMFIGISVYAQQVPKFSSSNIIMLTVTFDVPPTNITVGKSALRYNKAFAYSFILDDGLIDAYTAAFPLLYGGLVTGNDTVYPGYFYSDGCGNAIPFSAGLSWYSVNSAGTDLHVNTPGYVTWDQLTTMYNAGWNVLNHSYSHAANDTAIDYVYQITQNTSYVKSRCGIDLSHFVPPAGDQNYVIPAFANGMLSVTGNNGAYNGSPDGYAVDQPIDFNNFTLYKMLVSDANQNTANIMQKIDTVASRSVNGAHFWWSDFTHHVGFQSSGASLLFPLFRFYMENIAQQYGITGSDNLWMSPTQDVYEYLRVRDNSVVSYSLTGNVLTITVDYSTAPAKMRTNALTLVIQADQNFSSVAATGLQKMTFNGTGNNKLINLQWGDPLISVNEIDPAKQTNVCNISVYPNPFINKLGIDFSEAVKGETNFELLNIAGKTIFTKTVIQPKGESHYELNLNEISLQPGIYFLKSVNGLRPFPTVKVMKIQK